MILKALKYKSGLMLGNWAIISGTAKDDFVQFENINLIVGRNATGKTRIIEAIRKISDLFDAKTGNIIDTNEVMDFEIVFQNKEDLVQYILKTNYGDLFSIEVENEKLLINDNVKLDRSKGLLYYEELKDNLEFELESTFLAIARRDDKQQPFFKMLHDWGKNVSHYSFGGNMGKGQSEKTNDIVSLESLYFKNSRNIRFIYKMGIDSYSTDFEKIIIHDMSRVDYKILSISLHTLSNYLSLTTKEVDLPFPTSFSDMSQGMARAFSLIVQLNYSLMAKIPSCILIDDIGEGLDYDRSKKLIELIIEKAEGSNIQVFMTTNDRFVMNSVPLKYWSVIHREGNKSVFYNYQNSKQTFDDFALTGFNNFDFFATEFYRLGFEEFIQTA